MPATRPDQVAPGTTVRRSPARLLALVTAIVVVATAVGCSSSSDEEPASPTTTAPSTDPRTPGEDPVVVEDGVRIEVLSSQPDRVTGPDARIRVTPDDGGSPRDLVVTLDGRDVTASLTEVDGALEGVVVGLVEGNNTVRAHDRSTVGPEAVRRLRSWPLQGPMISGPQRPLLACSTEEHGLGPPGDGCSAPTRVRWYAVTTTDQVVELTDPASLPDDVAEVAVTNATGEQEAPFVLRRETGVLNRSIYDIATIDPSPAAPDDDQRDALWNGRLLHRFGGGCRASHGQGTAPSVLDDIDLLRSGYAVTTASFNVGSTQCNDVVSAETTMMVKERFIELFGAPDHTIGVGESGGGIQVHLIAQNYPGLLDGGATVEAFPDHATLMNGIADCRLLERWFDGSDRSDGSEVSDGSALTPEQRAAVTGHATADTCSRWSEEFPAMLDPASACDPAIPVGALFDAEANPAGVRCTYQDEAANIFGVDPETGRARRPLDNVGVQYGLDALNDGVITFDQFAALNRDVGGFDLDGGFQVLRHEADHEAVALAYETGRVSSGSGDQRKIPIITVDVWNDPTGDVHEHVRPLSLRDRLTFGRSPAVAPGFQIWTVEPDVADATGGAQARSSALRGAVGAVDDWLSTIDGDSTRGSREDVLERNRPDHAGDRCTIPGRPEPVTGLHLYDEPSECSERYGPSQDPRMAAGATLANDVIKCSLKPVDPSDYRQPITNRQYEVLLEVFPTGVCDWELPGVGQTSPSMSDRSFEDVITPEQMA